MINFLNQFAFLLAQAGERPSGAKPEVPEGAAEEPSFFSNILMFAPAILGVMLVYFLLSGRPQQKQKAKANALLESIKKNDRVLTAGGILGTVVNKDEEYVTIRIDDTSNAKMQILKTSIVRVITDESDKPESKS